MAVLRIDEIECYAFHGCLPAESVIGQRYSVDVIFEGDFTKATESDTLFYAIDYCLVYGIVKNEMAVPSKLIEHAAGRILRALKSLAGNEISTTVRLTKYNPPVNGNIRKVSFELKA